jgi:hypothetical protein
VRVSRPAADSWRFQPRWFRRTRAAKRVRGRPLDRKPETLARRERAARGRDLADVVPPAEFDEEIGESAPAELPRGRAEGRRAERERLVGLLCVGRREMKRRSHFVVGFVSACFAARVVGQSPCSEGQVRIERSTVCLRSGRSELSEAVMIHG